MLTFDDKLQAFEELLDCAEGIALWRYNGKRQLMHSSSKNPELFRVLFQIGNSADIIWEQVRKSHYPQIVSDDFSLTWLAVPYVIESVLVDLYVVGPIFSSAVSEQSLIRRIQSSGFSIALKDFPLHEIGSIPVMPHQMLIVFALMLYRCIYSEKISLSDVLLISHEHTPSSPDENGPSLFAKESDYELEQEILLAVEQGNIHYVHPQATLAIRVGNLSTEGPLRQAKNMMLTFITSITRAAIRGGMPVRAAFALSDTYVLASESSTTVNDVYQNGRSALKDFTQRVHKIKSEQYSSPVNACIAYIQLHMFEPIVIADMAKEIGYSKNYLGALFRQETGQTPGQYINAEKLRLAAVSLESGNKSIHAICHELGFDSLSYFSAQFRKLYGVSPSQYRKNSV